MLNGFLESRHLTPLADLVIALENQWKVSNSGTTTAQVTLACPASTNGLRLNGLAITSLYATGDGGTLTISNDAGDELTFLLTATPLQLTWALGLPIEKGNGLTIAIAGASAGASITATGIVLR